MDELKRLATDIIDDVCDVVEQKYGITPKNFTDDKDLENPALLNGDDYYFLEEHIANKIKQRSRPFVLQNDLGYPLHISFQETFKEAVEEAVELNISLEEQNLEKVDLSNCCLKNHMFDNCSFEDADLSGANLMYSNLQAANMQRANIKGADLTEADLRGANLTGVEFDGNTKLTNAEVNYSTEMDEELKEFLIAQRM